MTIKPVEAPRLEPLRNSHEADSVEADLKALFLRMFDENIRAPERVLNVYGMPHLGSFELIERIVTGDGLALFRRDDQEAMRYLFKAWKARNPKRGLVFLKTYLQLLWPNGWEANQYWHLKNSEYPKYLAKRSDIPGSNPHATHYLTSRVTVQIYDENEDGAGLKQVVPSLRSVVPARILLLITINRDFINDVKLADAATFVTVTAFGGIAQLPQFEPNAMPISNGATFLRMAAFEGEALPPT